MADSHKSVALPSILMSSLLATVLLLPTLTSSSAIISSASSVSPPPHLPWDISLKSSTLPVQPHERRSNIENTAATQSPVQATVAASAISIILPSLPASAQLALDDSENRQTGNKHRWCPQKCTCTVEQGKWSSTSSETPKQQSSNIWDKLMTASGLGHKGESSEAGHPHHHQMYSVDCTAVGLTNLSNFWQISSTSSLARPLVSSLILSSNELTTLTQNQFKWPAEGAVSPIFHLRRLLLDGNRLEVLLNDTFSALHSLEHLNLAFNRLSKLEPYCFQGLSKLLTLDLSGNQLKVFPSHQLHPALLPSLTEVNLRQNAISWVPEEAFSGGVNNTKMGTEISSKLVKFDLSENPLQEVHSRAFVNLRHLRRLYLSSMERQDQFPSLVNCDSLEHIKLDRGRLTEIDTAMCHHVGGTAKSLVLKSNRITHLPSFFHLCTELRVLDLSYNELNTLGANHLLGQSKLIDLALQYNQIEVIEQSAFAGLTSLQVLNLEGNRILAIDLHAFVPLLSLQDINLGHNLFSVLPTEGLSNLLELKVHGNRHLRDFPPVSAFPYIAQLALSYAYHCCPYVGRLQRTKVDSTSFDRSQLNDSILWPEDTDPSKLNETIFELTQQISKQYGEGGGGSFSTDELLASAVENSNPFWEEGNQFEQSSGHSNYRVYHQPGQGPHSPAAKYIRCLPAPSPFMPCTDLFDWWTLRFAVWLVFPLALLGNGTVLLVLVFGRRRRSNHRGRRKMDVPRFLVCNLAAADLFMGVYLGMLALVDASTLGRFRAYALRWQGSWACQLTGFTGVFSTELSVFTLAVITLERNYAITHAMHLNKRLSLRAATTIMSCGWVLALALAILPLFGISDYRKFAVCLPLEASDSPWSLLYVVALLTINGTSFLLLLGCYLRMYCAIRGSQAWNSNDTRIAMRMGLLVATDFACYAPIAFFSLTALLGYKLISLEEAKVFTVFVLPLNACMDPFLYAVFSRQFKKECSTLFRRVDAFTKPVTRHCAFCRCHTKTRNSTADNAVEGFAVVPGKAAASSGHKHREQVILCKACGHRSGVLEKDKLQHSSIIHSISSHAIEHRPASMGKAATAVLVTSKLHQSESEHEKAEVVILQQKQKQLDASADKETVVVVAALTGDKKSIIDEEKESSHCKCQCHMEAKRQGQLSSDDSGERSLWSAGQLVRTLFFIGGPSEHHKSTSTVKGGQQVPHSSSSLFTKRRSVSSSGGGICGGKQFKSNSIIYQSNYKKNHVHMTLENEVVRSSVVLQQANQSNHPHPHPQLTRFSSDTLETRRRAKEKSQENRSKSQQAGRKVSSPCVQLNCSSNEKWTKVAAVVDHEHLSGKCEMASGSKDVCGDNGTSNGNGNNQNNTSECCSKSHKSAMEKTGRVSGGPLASSSISSKERETSKVNNSSEDDYCTSSSSSTKAHANERASNEQHLSNSEEISEGELESSSADLGETSNNSSNNDNSRSRKSHYISHRNYSHQRVTATTSNTSAMASGILMLKNKLISRSCSSKNYTRKTSSDSQYEFNYYGRRESSSTTGRTSFSSDAATKSTSVEMAETVAGGATGSGSATEPDGPKAKTWEIEEVEDEFDSVEVDYQNNNNNKLQSSKLQSSSHEKILNFLQILLPKSARLGGGSGNSSAGSSTSGRKSAEKSSKSGGGKNSKTSSSSALINTTRRSSSAFVLGEDNTLLFHKCSPGNSRQLTDNSPHVKSCTQLQSAVVGSSTSCGSTSTSGTVAGTTLEKQQKINTKIISESTGESRCRSAAEVRTSDQIGRHEGRPISSGHIIIIRSASPTLSHTDQILLPPNTVTTPPPSPDDQQTGEKHYRSFEFIA